MLGPVDTPIRRVLDERRDLPSFNPLPRTQLGARGMRVELVVLGDALTFWWGLPDQIGTASYWTWLCHSVPPPNYRLGLTLAEEVVGCLLGGFGVPSDVAYSAFERVRDCGVTDSAKLIHCSDLERILAEPMEVSGRARRVKYRYPRQRARRIATAIEYLSRAEAPTQTLALREWLLLIPGVGPKTASWIARNLTSDDEVAVIDVHVYRAGRAAGFFSRDWQLPRDYVRFELAFLAVSRMGGVGSTALDCCIWAHMRALGVSGRSLIES